MGRSNEEAQMRALLLPVAAGAGDFGGHEQGHHVKVMADEMGISVAVMILFPIPSF